MTSRLLDLCRLGARLAVAAVIVLLCGSSVLAPAQGDPLPKIGYLGFGAATPPTFFQKRMRELGYSEGKDVEVEVDMLDLPYDFDSLIAAGSMSGSSAIIRQKLTAHRPATLGQAARISGVTPAALGALLKYVRRRAA